MKWFALSILSLSIVGCSSWSSPKKFKRKEVCSDDNMAYIQAHKSNYKKVSESKKIQKRLSKIEDQVKACYKAEVKSASWIFGKPSFNLCLVGGYDASGAQDHFEFSTKQYSMSKSLIQCLSVIKTNPALAGLKNVTFMQPYRMTPKKK